MCLAFWSPVSGSLSTLYTPKERQHGQQRNVTSRQVRRQDRTVDTKEDKGAKTSKQTMTDIQIWPKNTVNILDTGDKAVECFWLSAVSSPDQTEVVCLWSTVCLLACAPVCLIASDLTSRTMNMTPTSASLFTHQRRCEKN